MNDINMSAQFMDLVLMFAIAIVIVIVWVYMSMRASNKRVVYELRKGVMIGGAQFLPSDSELLLVTSDEIWPLMHYYRTPKGSFFVYCARFGYLGWGGSKFYVIAKEEAMEVVGNTDIKRYTEVFGKPHKA